jgi:hypothetical protein
MIKREVWYFRGVGPQNTPACLDLADRAVAEGFRHLVVASTTGDSGAQAARRLQDKEVNLVVVGHSVGYKGPNLDEFLEEHHQEITRLKGKVLKATILTHSLEASLAEQFKGSAPTLLIANTLRRLGQGLKVCCEIVMEGGGGVWHLGRPRHRGSEPGDLDAIPTGLFGSVKGGICGGDYLFGSGSVVRKKSHPQRKGRAFKKTVLVFYLERLHCQAHIFRQLQSGLQ